MIVCLLMLMVRDDCLNKQSLTITINKQTIISHHYHQKTTNHLSPLPSTNKNHLSPLPSDDCLLMVMVRDDWLPSTNKQSSLTITINKHTIISHHYH
jgi:hypothetical protein